MNTEIVRELPASKIDLVEIEIYRAYEGFQMVDRLKQNHKFMTLMDGINPETGRKITRNGNIYREVLQQIMREMDIRSICVGDYEKYSTIEDRKEYIKELKLKQAPIIEWNNSVAKLREDVAQLKRWDEFVEFNGVRYGIDLKMVEEDEEEEENDSASSESCDEKKECRRFIHIENNCGGTMKLIETTIVRDRCDDDHGWCTLHGDLCEFKTRRNCSYKCDRCGFQSKRVIFE